MSEETNDDGLDKTVSNPHKPAGTETEKPTPASGEPTITEERGPDAGRLPTDPPAHGPGPSSTPSV